MPGLIEKYHIAALDETSEIDKFAELYTQNGIVPVRLAEQAALTLAITISNNIDIIFSLNFKHINKPKTKTMGMF